MSLDPNKLYGIAQSLAEVAKDEYGENGFIGFSKILKVCKTSHFAELLLSRVSTPADKVKLVFMSYLIITGRYKKETIIGLSSRLFLYVIDFYDNTEEIKQECSYCEGSGDEECDRCDGTGNEDCKYCDGDGKVECYECSGEGTEECRYCDGKGTETEEDDEGDEIEVECIHCDGEGKERCRSCGGSGNFECPECEGSGNETCSQCDGSRAEECDFCYGYGEIDSEEDYYSVTRKTYVVVGSKIKNIDGEIMSEEDFSELVYNNKIFSHELVIGTYNYADSEEKEDRLAYAKMDDNFVEIVDVLKLEDYK